MKAQIELYLLLNKYLLSTCLQSLSIGSYMAENETWFLSWCSCSLPKKTRCIRETVVAKLYANWGISQLVVGRTVSGPVVKNLLPMQGTRVQSLVSEIRSHIPAGNEAQALQPLSQSAQLKKMSRVATKEAATLKWRSCVLQLRPKAAKFLKKERKWEYQLETVSVKAFLEQVGLQLTLKNAFIVAGSLLLHNWANCAEGSRADGSRSGGMAGEGRSGPPALQESAGEQPFQLDLPVPPPSWAFTPPNCWPLIHCFKSCRLSSS